MNPEASSGKNINRALIVVIVILALAVVGLLAAFALGSFAPKQDPGSLIASSSSSQSSVGSSSASTQSNSAGGDSKGKTSSSSSSASSSTSSSASDDSKKAAVNSALNQGYQIFEGTLHVMTTTELANLQGIDPDMFTANGKHVVLEFDAPFQVSGMGSDGSGMRRQSASMLGVAEHTDHGSFVVDKGDVDYWLNLDGAHMTLGAMADQIWFPSDVSLPVGEPSTESAVVIFVD